MGYSKRDMLEREAGIEEFADIGSFIDGPVKQYSSGMYMRLGFAIATEVNPDILIMDEILAVGDLGFQQKCFERLRRFRESGATILLVSHSPDQILEHCDRVLVLDKGKLIFDGLPAEGIELYRECTVQAPDLVEANTGR
jgi:ABC-type polysaccharide/polyol phosphate transport system ATPase subunit